MPWVENIGEEDAEFIDFIKNYRLESRPKVMALWKSILTGEYISLRIVARQKHIESVAETTFSLTHLPGTVDDSLGKQR